jgi:hypothetical protein
VLRTESEIFLKKNWAGELEEERENLVKAVFIASKK